MAGRKPLMAANWKMNLSLRGAKELLNNLKSAEIDFGKVDVLVAPPFTTLSLARGLLSDTAILLGGQNAHWEESGAFTGEISAPMLKEAGCTHVIIGHSERRTHFFETSEMVNRKAVAVLEAGLVPIICIGETLQEREEHKTFDVIREQLSESLGSFCQKHVLPQNLIFAYEPVWAIGTGKTATPQEAQEVQAFIRSWLKQSFDTDTSEAVRILYGGSVKPDNIRELMTQPDIDGALIGGASLKADSFLAIVRFYEG
jgi:triosephosphate isomerase